MWHYDDASMTGHKWGQQKPGLTKWKPKKAHRIYVFLDVRMEWCDDVIQRFWFGTDNNRCGLDGRNPDVTIPAVASVATHIRCPNMPRIKPRANVPV